MERIYSRDMRPYVTGLSGVVTARGGHKVIVRDGNLTEILRAKGLRVLRLTIELLERSYGLSGLSHNGRGVTASVIAAGNACEDSRVARLARLKASLARRAK